MGGCNELVVGRGGGWDRGYGFLSVDLALVQQYGFFPAQLNHLVLGTDQLPSEGGTKKECHFCLVLGRGCDPDRGT